MTCYLQEKWRDFDALDVRGLAKVVDQAGYTENVDCTQVTLLWGGVCVCVCVCMYLYQMSYDMDHTIVTRSFSLTPAGSSWLPCMVNTGMEML